MRTFWMALVLLVSGGAMAQLPAPSNSPSAVVMSAEERQTLRSTFIRTLENEIQALRQRHRSEAADLNASQRARLKQLKKTRRDFLKSDQFKKASRKQRREYGKDFTARFKALNELFAAERKGRTSDQKAAEASLRGDQKRRLEEFDGALNQGFRPSDLLWTPPGR